MPTTAVESYLDNISNVVSGRKFRDPFEVCLRKTKKKIKIIIIQTSVSSRPEVRGKKNCNGWKCKIWCIRNGFFRKRIFHFGQHSKRNPSSLSEAGSKRNNTLNFHTKHSMFYYYRSRALHWRREFFRRTRSLKINIAIKLTVSSDRKFVNVITSVDTNFQKSSATKRPQSWITFKLNCCNYHHFFFIIVWRTPIEVNK